MSEQAVTRELPESAEDEVQEAPLVLEIEQVAQNTSRKLLTLVTIGAGLFLVVHLTPFGQQIRDWDALAELLKAGGFRADLYFVLISSFLIMAGVPRLVFCGLAGFVFGFWEGLLWSLFGSLIGSFAAFRAARWGGREWLVHRFGRRRFFGRIVHATPTIASVVLIRMLPVSNVIVNVGLALSRVGNRAFLLGSLVGFVPQGLIAVVIGSGMAQDVPWAGAAQIGVAALLLLAIFFWASRKRLKKS